jgi:hypothetical protein
VFQIKDLTVGILPGRGAFLGPNCRISATDPPVPGCAPRSARPRPEPPAPKTPRPPDPRPSAACGHQQDQEPRRAAGLDELRRELRAVVGPA